MFEKIKKCRQAIKRHPEAQDQFLKRFQEFSEHKDSDVCAAAAELKREAEKVALLCPGES